MTAALLILLGVGTTLASTLKNYRERVHQAMVALDALRTLSEDASATEPHQTEASTLQGVRRSLPPTERVEWEGGQVVVDNSWLHTELESYTEIASDQQRAEILGRIGERLHALDNRLVEASAAKKSRARDTEAEKGKLAAILRRPEYNVKTSQGGALQRLAEQIMRWLRALFPKIKPMQTGTATQLSNVVRIVIYALALAVILFVARRYVPDYIRRRRAGKKSAAHEARIILGHTLAPGQSPAGLLAEAESLARQGDVRGAIRKAYIALLCELGDRKILHLAQHKTNRDYLRAIRERAPLYREMQPLTLNFERHWYGFEAATETDWQDFRSRYQKILNVTPDY